jgi:hypothetical protein
MEFWTDITTKSSRKCLLNFKYINDKRRNDKDSFKIDPDVGHLKISNEYDRIELLHELAKNLKENEELSIDYPCDMIQTTQYEPKAYIDLMEKLKQQLKDLKEKLKTEEDIRIEVKILRKISKLKKEINLTKRKHKLPANYIYDCNTFIQKSYYNNVLYADNSRYICTIQFEKESFHSFKVETKRLKKIWKNPNKVIGIGNMCRIFNTNEFSDKLYRWIIKYMPNRRIHIYGMSLKHIKKYVPLLEAAYIEVSTDSTKWTRAVTKELKEKHGLNCNSKTRDLYFETYIKEIEKAGIKVEY